ncbi:YdeI/OmpD-associated family protein [Reinekea marina]|uniref:YdeI family protein n=1 Tax=Reinekea marina TaxID=1310421 RepID=A0ABV7WW65_9GAMM|nr:YdeI/OmpD-associated family protein [Reinekea marina]MDN3647489.1 YdeI/OmpD-associated family protein [Reinekea marina]
MKKKITTIEEYFTIGCGRCEKGSTPDCKVHTWAQELAMLRQIALSAGLVEELKWSQPCYTYQGTNIVIVSAFKQHAIMTFFKGSLLKDPENILHKPGPNSESGRVAKFTSVDDIKKYKNVLAGYIQEGIELVRAGKKVEKNTEKYVMPEELLVALESDPEFFEAFEQLTPGRQRSYFLHVSSAKQSKTRSTRALKIKPKVISGLGFNEYQKG